MKYLAIFVIAMLPLSGCASTHDLSEEYAPLKVVSERPWYASWIGGSESLITTIGEAAYVKDLDVWLEARPVGSPRYRSVLHHERTHSWRQKNYGLAGWLKSYLSDKDFRWREESLGWFVQIQLGRRSGLGFYPEAIAKTLAGYSPKMITYEEALVWVRDVMSGRWKPQPGDLPADLEEELNVR